MEIEDHVALLAQMMRDVFALINNYVPMVPIDESEFQRMMDLCENIVKDIEEKKNAI